ncbi:transcription termination/antitermination NusG family protein, partial [Acetobacterium sp.]|uniref:transcription termination/antitermination NusG family protein n=1 Tax=Acetobacterium sp. TaxID=1872094 RepID=UPI002F3FEFF1
MENNQQDEAQWFVAHTYSGYENKVKASIEATVENRNMEELILEVQVPVQEVAETKN